MGRTLLILAVPWLLSAQESFSLRQAVDEALAQHPLLAAARQSVESAEGQRLQAGLRPNPRFTLQTENLRKPGNPPFVFLQGIDQFAFLQVPFETAGKRDRRLELADAGVRRRALELELLQRQIAGRVALAYWAAAGARREYELVRAYLDNFAQIVSYHESRVKEGAMAEVDLLRVRLEAGRLALTANSARLEADRARIQLLREMGRGAFGEVNLTETLELDGDAPRPADPDAALPRRPEIRLAQVLVEEAQRAAGLQQALARPNIEAIAGYKLTSGLNTVIAGLQTDLALLNRNQGNIATARVEIRVAESNLKAAEALVRAEVSAAASAYLLRRQQVRDLNERLRGQAREVSSIAQAAYREGGADLLRLLDAERLRLEIEQLSVRAWMEYRQSIVALDVALGVQP